MGNVAPGDTFDGGGAGLPFLLAADKKRLAAAKTALYVTSVTAKTTSKFGDEVRYDLKWGKGEDECGTLTLKHNAVRERQANDCLKLFAGGATSVGPLYLIQGTAKDGNQYWALSGQPMDGEVLDLQDDAETPAESVAAAASGDDGIPF